MKKYKVTYRMNDITVRSDIIEMTTGTAIEAKTVLHRIWDGAWGYYGIDEIIEIRECHTENRTVSNW